MQAVHNFALHCLNHSSGKKQEDVSGLAIAADGQMKISPEYDQVLPEHVRARQGKERWDKCNVRSSHQEPVLLWFGVSWSTCFLALMSAISQLRDDNRETALPAIAISASCLLCSALSLLLSLRLTGVLLEACFVLQVVVINATLMVLSLTHSDPVDRSMNLAWHSVGFKLLPLSWRFCWMIQLASSCAIDVCVHAALVWHFGGSIDWRSMVFLAAITCYVATLCVVKSRRQARQELIEDGMQDLLAKILTEAFDSWVFLDGNLRLQRSIGDFKQGRAAKRANDLVLQMTSKDGSTKSGILREAFQASRNAAFGTARARDKGGCGSTIGVQNRSLVKRKGRLKPA